MEAQSALCLSGQGKAKSHRLRRWWLLLIPWVAANPVLGADEERERSVVELGRRIYSEGLLPDGSPLRANSSAGLLLEGKSAACVTCHRHSGMGSVEGSGVTTVLVPPLVGPLLFRAALFHERFIDTLHHRVPNEAWVRALQRSAYDEQKLGRALREGLDADGKRLLPPMPHYALDEQAIAALAAYLKQLGVAPAPGVEADTLHLATIITPEAPAAQAEAVVGVVQAWAARTHSATRRWRLHVWRVTGGAERWEAQLQALYRQQPVFAVLSGAGGAHWSPIHRFCEENRLPCLLPSVELAPEREGDYYPIYYSPGVALEARVLASHLNGAAAPPRITQLFSDTTGREAAQRLGAHLKAAIAPPLNQHYSSADPGRQLKRIVPDTALVLWLRPAELQQLVASAPQGPAVEQIFLSAMLAPPEEVTLPPEWKVRVRWVSLFDDLGVQGEIARLRLQRWLQQQGLPSNGALRVQGDAYAACYLFNAALAAISSEQVRRYPVPLNREHLIESVESMVNKYSDGTPWVNSESHVVRYGRMSLGPGQRVAVRGGTLLRYAAPDSYKLVVASERIVP